MQRKNVCSAWQALNQHQPQLFALCVVPGSGNLNGQMPLQFAKIVRQEVICSTTAQIASSTTKKMIANRAF
jgi:hypothetical protein